MIRMEDKEKKENEEKPNEHSKEKKNCIHTRRPALRQQPPPNHHSIRRLRKRAVLGRHAGTDAALDRTRCRVRPEKTINEKKKKKKKKVIK
jgi:hypothetical protein